jgi:hypothetical protein
MSLLTDDDLITFLQIKVFLDEDFTDSAFRAKLLKKYITLNQWIDSEDLTRMSDLVGAVTIQPRKSKCTKCRKSQITIDLICNTCYSTCIQLL